MGVVCARKATLKWLVPRQPIYKLETETPAKKG